MKQAMQWLKSEPVLAISAVLALASCLVIPPDAAYLGYVDGRVLALLYCLMAVVAGMEQAGAFTAGDQTRRTAGDALLFLLPAGH